MQEPRSALDAVSPGWLELARELQLDVQPAMTHQSEVYLTLRGEVDGHPVALQLAPRGRSGWLGEVATSVLTPYSALFTWVHEDHWEDGALRLEVPIRARPPEDLSVQHEDALSEALKYIGLDDLRVGDPALDQALRIRSGARDEARALIARPDVADALRRLQRFVPPSQISDSRVVLYHRTHTIEIARELIVDGVHIAATLEAALDAPWREAAEARGLQLGPYGALGYRTIVGALEGAELHVWVEQSGGLRRRPETWIVASLDLPCRLTLGKRRGELPRVRTGNPIVDGAAAVRCDDADWARRVIAAPQNTGAMMAVFSAYPETSLEENQLEMKAAGALNAEALGARLDAIAALARAWSAA